MEQIGDWFVGFLLSNNVLLAAILIPLMLAIEWFRPAHATPARHYAFNIAFGFSNMALLALIMPAVSTGLAIMVQRLGFGLIDLRGMGFGGIGGALFALFVSAFITDFFYYWFHRTMHASSALWQVHLLHHSDEHMNATTSQRGHIIETLLAPIFIALPLAILFELPPVTIGILSVLPQAYQYLAHANIKLSYGPFWWLLISPQFHRIHHSIEPQHIDRNFANWYPFWDIVFGTAYRPQPGEYPETGVDGVKVKTLAEAYLLPFRGWLEMVRKQASSSR